MVFLPVSVRTNAPRFLALLVAVAFVPLAPSAGAAEGSLANIQFEADIPAPVVALAASSDSRHLAVVDDDARFTFIPDAGAESLEWQAPNSGVLGTLDAMLAEVPPSPIGVAVTPDGEHYAGSVAYTDSFPGKVYGFARWSDAPIWTFSLPAPPSYADTADQPTVLTAGGPYHALGTSGGTVYLLVAEDQGSTTKSAHRTYTRDNEGNRFTHINSLAMSRDGSLILIGTDGGGVSSLHLFSDVFFRATFHRITEPVQLTAMSADGTRGAAVTGTGTGARIHFLDLENAKTLWESSIGSTVTHLALSADGGVLVAGTDGGRVAVFHATGEAIDRKPTVDHSLGATVTGVAVSDRGDAIAAVTEGGKLHFLDDTRKAPLWTHDAGNALVGVALGADDESLAFAARSTEAGRVVYATADHAVSQVAPPEPRLLPGEANPIGIVVGNGGNRLEKVSAEWGLLPEGWEGLDANITLAPAEQQTFTLKLFVKKGQAPGQHTLPIDLVTDHQRIPLRLKAVVPQVTSGHTEILWQFDTAVPGGAPAAFLLQLTNTGNTPNDVALGYARLPAGWRAEFTGPTELSLRAGEDRSSVLKVWAPRDAPIGRDGMFDLVLAWKSGEERHPLAVRLIEPSTYYDLLTKQIDGGGTKGAEPLATSLREVSLADLKSSQQAKKVEEKGSPGIGLVVPIVALAGLLAVARKRRGA